jgi:ribose-phosphate pyrophosphokinase
MITVNGVNIEPTIFPDKTSQVWKLSNDLIQYIKDTDSVEVVWNFENESEIIHILQLKTLINTLMSDEADCVLIAPYLPYARQDKDINNESTFALHTFLSLMSAVFDSIEVFDPHSAELLQAYFGDRIKIVSPQTKISFALNDSDSYSICFPDAGAQTRYPFLSSPDNIVITKVRNQSTGEITGLTINNPTKVRGARVLIVDDLCDGGRTFVEASKILYANGARAVSLYVSHGIFSKGLEVLHQSGINKIYTKEGLVSSR